MMKKFISTLLLSIVMFMFGTGLSLAQSNDSGQQPADGGSAPTTSSQPGNDGEPAPSDDKPDPAAISNIPT